MDIDHLATKRGALAFTRFANGVTGELLNPPAALRRAAIVAASYHWAVLRTNAEARYEHLKEIAEIGEMLEAEQGRLVAEADEVPLDALRTSRAAETRIRASAAQFEVELVALDAALDDVARHYGFDSNATRALIGASRWPPCEADAAAVVKARRDIVAAMVAIITRLEV